MTKHTIKGKKGETVYYIIPNIRFDGTYLTWDAFKFYTPTGNQNDGFNYFNIPSEEILIQRDDTLNKEFYILITAQEVEMIEVLEGAEYQGIKVGLEGDIVATGIIPADPAEDISIEYKEVIDG